MTSTERTQLLLPGLGIALAGLTAPAGIHAGLAFIPALTACGAEYIATGAGAPAMG